MQQKRLRFLGFAHGHKYLCQADTGLGVVWLQPHGLAVTGVSVVQIVSLQGDITQPVHQTDRFPKLPYIPSRLLRGPQRSTECSASRPAQNGVPEAAGRS